MGDTKIAFNANVSYKDERFVVYVDNESKSVMVDVVAGLSMKHFAPVAIGLAKYHGDKTLFLNVGMGEQLPVFKNDTSRKLFNRFLRLSPFGGGKTRL